MLPAVVQWADLGKSPEKGAAFAVPFGFLPLEADRRACYNIVKSLKTGRAVFQAGFALQRVKHAGVDYAMQTKAAEGGRGSRPRRRTGGKAA